MENSKHGSRKPNVKVNGLVNVSGMKFHDIEGGFGEGKKAMLIKDIANIHGRELRVINQNIERNKSRFKEGIDIIDLKSVTQSDRDLLNELGFSNSSIANANNIYLLSERGYSKLLKILEDDFAWEQYDKLVDGYFQMREQAIKARSSRPLSAMDQLRLQYQVLEEHGGKIVQIEGKIDDLENNLPLFNVECKELQALVRKKGVEILGGKGSLAYKNNSVRCKVYSDIQQQLRREFGVSRYEAIKRHQLSIAHEIVANYKAPSCLIGEIELLNQQLKYAL